METVDKIWYELVESNFLYPGIPDSPQARLAFACQEILSSQAGKKFSNTGIIAIFDDKLRAAGYPGNQCRRLAISQVHTEAMKHASKLID